MSASGGLRILHHRTATSGVDRNNGGFKRVNRLDCFRNSVGNIVQFQIKENR